MSSSEPEPVSDVEINDDLEIVLEGAEEPLETEAQEQTNENQGDNEATGIQEGDTDNKTVVKPKRVVRNPQPKFNESTLKTPRGLPAIESYFERAKFKGKGHEEQDLNVLMKTYEYWCHRLFPKFPFDTCIERLEKLGSKNATRVQIKRIRMGIADEEKPINSDEDANEDQPATDGFVDSTNDQFDQLLPASSRTEPEITDEQLEKIRLNKERAERLRREILQKIKEKSSLLLQSQEITSQNSQIVETDMPGTSRDSRKKGAQFEASGEDNDQVGLDEILNDINDEDEVGRVTRKKHCRILNSDDESESENETASAKVQLELELTEKQKEQIRRNKERAEKLKQEKVRKLKNQNSDTNVEPTPSTSTDIEMIEDQEQVDPEQILMAINGNLSDSEHMEVIESGSQLIEADNISSHKNGENGIVEHIEKSGKKTAAGNTVSQISNEHVCEATSINGNGDRQPMENGDCTSGDDNSRAETDFLSEKKSVATSSEITH